MSARQFEKVSVREGATVTSRYRLICGSCGCGETLSQQSFGGGVAADIVPKKFGERGWQVGKRSNGADDLCPACVNREQEKRRNKGNVVPIAVVAESTTEVPKADPPREMTREHRRLIFLKLEEIYLDERAGYSAGWSDAKVATDLGVPRAWVSVIRDENFGPGTSEEVERLLAEIRSLTQDYAAFKEAAAKLIAQSGDLSKRLDTLQKTASRIEQGVR